MTVTITVHVHVWAAGSYDERQQLLFRDLFRDRPRVKRELVGQSRDVNHYADAKSAVIDEIVERARRANSLPD